MRPGPIPDDDPIREIWTDTNGDVLVHTKKTGWTKVVPSTKQLTEDCAHVSLLPWHTDRRYDEIWVSDDGTNWTMRGMKRDV